MREVEPRQGTRQFPSSVEILPGMLPAPMAVKGAGIEFSREWKGDGVEIEVTYPAGTWANWSATETRSLVIPREAWDAVVAHVAEEERP